LARRWEIRRARRRPIVSMNIAGPTTPAIRSTIITLNVTALMNATLTREGIDPRSFRIFERHGDCLLFDRATGATVRVHSESLAGVLHGMQRGRTLEEALEEESGANPETDVDSITEVMEALREKGFFQYTPVVPGEQEAMIQALWEHRPKRVQMLMAQGCNLGCRYCYAWRNGSNQKKTLMPFEIAKASVDHLVRNSGSRTELQVTFFGGEPLLNYEVIRQVVAYCRDLETKTPKRFTFELITNGTLLHPEVADWVAAEKFLLFVSIDGWEEMHNHNRPSMSGDNMYETIVRNAKYANARYEAAGLPLPKVRANLTEKFHDTAKVGEYLASLGFKVIGVGAIEPLPHGDPSPSALTEDQADALHERTGQQMYENVQHLLAGGRLEYFQGVQMRKSVAQLTPRRLKGITCGVARNTQVVDNKGTLAYYRKVNRNATNRCHSCWIRDYCAGGCAWLLSAKDGHLADPTERECNRRRKSMELGLWLRQKMRTHFPERFTTEGEMDLDAWDWGSANQFDEASEEEIASLRVEEPSGSSCGSGCETCGPTGCSD
jgi:uncharacterized protein